MRFRYLLLPVVATVLLAGCAADRRSNTLTTTLHAYGSTLRWGDFASARQFLDPEYRESHPLSSLEESRYRQVRVSDYDDGHGPVPQGENEVTQVVRIGLINVNTQAERSIVDRQTWRYDEAKNHWWLETGLPDISRDQ